MLKKFEDQSKIEEELHKQRVFVVHGRNEELRKSMFDFLRSIGLKPIEWSQAIQMTGETAPFVGEILDAAFQQAQAVVVLFNGDDEAHLRQEYHSDKMPEYEKNLTPQARPNVIFEAGLALGRFPKRTIIVEMGDLRPFSDLAGRHTIRMNNSTKARQELAQRLSLAGCNIDLSGTDWHQSGNFDVVGLSSSSAFKSEKLTNKFDTDVLSFIFGNISIALSLLSLLPDVRYDGGLSLLATTNFYTAVVCGATALYLGIFSFSKSRRRIYSILGVITAILSIPFLISSIPYIF
jgi:predicted nucleotide-binding protein